MTNRLLLAARMPDIRAPLNSSFSVGVLFILIEHFLVGWSVLSPFGWAAALAFLYAALLLKAGIDDLKKYESNRLEALASAWVNEAKTAKEKRERYEEFKRIGAAGVVASAGLPMLPSVNVDGTPMIPGANGLDFNGQMYGVPNASDTFNFDFETGMTVDAMEAYAGPIGMDSTDMSSSNISS